VMGRPALTQGGGLLLNDKESQGKLKVLRKGLDGFGGVYPIKWTQN
jgi:hypothetical protein